MEKGNTATEGSSESSESDGEATATDGGMTAATDSGGGGGSSAHPPASATVTNPDGSTMTSSTDADGNKTVTRTDADGRTEAAGGAGEEAEDVDYAHSQGVDYAEAIDEEGKTSRHTSDDGTTHITEYDSDGNLTDLELKEDGA